MIYNIQNIDIVNEGWLFGDDEKNNEPLTFKETKLKRVDNKIFSNGCGNRNKLGGKPDWINSEDKTPICPYCKEKDKKMCFHGQLDQVDEKHPIGKDGLIYVFYCYDCGGSIPIIDSH